MNIFLSSAIVAVLATSACAQPDAEKKAVWSVGVLPFSETDETKSLGASASQLVSAQLASSARMVMVERSDLDSVLSEQGMGLSGAVDPGSAAKVGQLAGAQLLVSGRVFKAGASTFCVAKAISVATGRSLPVQVEVKDDDWAGATAKIASDLEIKIIEAAADMFPQIESPDARLDRLKKLVAGKVLPKVHVRIPEQHLSRAVPDPAVQTEIEYTLRQLGAVVVTKEQDADVVVSGEAFSERAAQVSGLVSCRARCEINLTRTKSPGEKSVNRITTGAVDLAENTAAKLALQEAGARLADWIVGEITK